MIVKLIKQLSKERPPVFLHVFLLFYIVLSIITSAAYAQNTEPYNWSNVAIGGGGFVSGIITSKTQPGLIYTRTDVGGAYRWDAANSKWLPLLDLPAKISKGFSASNRWR